MSMASSGEAVDTIVGRVFEFLDWLPVPLYVSLLGVIVGASGLLFDIAGFPVVAALVGAYGVIMIGWGFVAWLIILLAVRVDSYRR